MNVQTTLPRLALRLCTPVLASVLLLSSPAAWSADHGDAPLVSNDQGADIADVYSFLDPNDNSRIVMIITARGFIVPGESENLGFFQDDLNWRFAIETSGDAAPDFNVEVEFAERTSFLGTQTATISVRRGSTRFIEFTAPTTAVSATLADAPPLVVTTDPTSNISFFSGMVDDPFFFDVPAELLFRQSLLNGTPDRSVFSRARDTFAGYNVMAVALSIPLSVFEATDNTFFGVSGYTELRQRTKRSRSLGLRSKGRFVNLDRMGVPAINTVLLPYTRKDTYNRGSTTQDAAGVYANDIVASLTSFGTNPDNINLLAGIAVNNGDILRLNTTVANSGAQGGTSPGAGFPNGRRLADDPIDIIVNAIANGLFNPSGVVDNVNANDKTFTNTFPFLAPPHQPRAAGVLDDATRN